MLCFFCWKRSLLPLYVKSKLTSLLVRLPPSPTMGWTPPRSHQHIESSPHCERKSWETQVGPPSSLRPSVLLHASPIPCAYSPRRCTLLWMERTHDTYCSLLDIFVLFAFDTFTLSTTCSGRGFQALPPRSANLSSQRQLSGKTNQSTEGPRPWAKLLVRVLYKVSDSNCRRRDGLLGAA